MYITRTLKSSKTRFTAITTLFAMSLALSTTSAFSADDLGILGGVDQSASSSNDSGVVDPDASLVGASAQASSSATDSSSAQGDSADDLMQGLTDLGPITDVASNASSMTQDAVGGVVSGVDSMVQDVTGGALTDPGAMAQNMMGSAQGMANQVGGQAAQVGGQIVGQVANVGKEIVSQSFQAGATALNQAVQSGMGTLSQGIATQLQPERVHAAVSGAMTAAASILGATVGALSDPTKRTNAMDKGKSLVNGILGMGKGLFGGNKTASATGTRQQKPTGSSGGLLGGLMKQQGSSVLGGATGGLLGGVGLPSNKKPAPTSGTHGNQKHHGNQQHHENQQHHGNQQQQKEKKPNLVNSGLSTVKSILPF